MPKRPGERIRKGRLTLDCSCGQHPDCLIECGSYYPDGIVLVGNGMSLAYRDSAGKFLFPEISDIKQRCDSCKLLYLKQISDFTDATAARSALESNYVGLVNQLRSAEIDRFAILVLNYDLLFSAVLDSSEYCDLFDGRNNLGSEDHKVFQIRDLNCNKIIETLKFYRDSEIEFFLINLHGSLTWFEVDEILVKRQISTIRGWGACNSEDSHSYWIQAIREDLKLPRVLFPPVISSDIVGVWKQIYRLGFSMLNREKNS